MFYSNCISGLYGRLLDIEKTLLMTGSDWENGYQKGSWVMTTV